MKGRDGLIAGRRRGASLSRHRRPLAARRGRPTRPRPRPTRRAGARRARRGRRRPIARQLHARAVAQPVAAFGDDALAGLEALGDCDHLVGRDAALDRPDRHRAVVVDDVDEVAARAAPQRRDRHDDRAVDRAQQQARVDELVREQRRRGVGEARLGLDGAGLHVDLVVERHEDAVVELLRARAVERGDGELGAGGDARLHLGNAVLRHRERDVDRRQLGDHGDAVGIAGADVVAGVDGAQADAAGDRRDDAAVAEVQARRVLVGAVDDQRALELLDQRRLGVDVLARDRVLAEQRLVALQLDPRAVELRLVALARADRLLQRDLERARIDRDEQLALLDDLPFAEQHLGDHARDLRPHGHRDDRRDRAERVEDDRQVGARRGRDADRARRRAATAAATAARAAGTGTACARAARRRHRDPRPKRPKPPRTRCRRRAGASGGRCVRYQASAARPISAASAIAAPSPRRPADSGGRGGGGGRASVGRRVHAGHSAVEGREG